MIDKKYDSKLIDQIIESNNSRKQTYYINLI